MDGRAEAGDIVVAQDAVQRAVAATGDARTEPGKQALDPAALHRFDQVARALRMLRGVVLARRPHQRDHGLRALNQRLHRRRIGQLAAHHFDA